MNFSLDSIKTLIVTYGLKILLALVVLIIGLRVVSWLTKLFTTLLTKRKLDPSLIPFLSSLFNALLKTMLVISVIGMLGIQTTSLVAVLGAAGLAVGLALSGMLQNFAGGVVILAFKPFKVGDYIDTGSNSGTVNAIQIFHTILKTPDNRTVILPNGSLSTSALTNFSTESTRRVDMTFGIGYTDDIDKAKATLMRLLTEDERVLKDPAPAVMVASLGDSSVNFTARPWVNASDYWGVYWDFQERVKKTFDSEGISIPFPQMDVHLDK